MQKHDRSGKLQRLQELQRQVQELESELTEPAQDGWRAGEYYTAYYATTGFMLGMFGAATSLLFNVVGSLLVGQHPLQLIKVYLTFPLKERALEMDSGLALAIGCCLYLGTGMLLGIPFYLILTGYTSRMTWLSRLVVACLLSAALWILNFYGILSWLQPLLFGGNWIVERIPWWVGLCTHLVFGGTLALLYPLGLYVPYRPQVEHDRSGS